MATTTSRRTVARRLDEFRRSDGNWRLKGLLLALSDSVDADAVGKAWPRQQPQSPRDYVHLSVREDDTNENAVARELYEADAISEGTVVPRDEYIGRALTSGTSEELDVLWREEILDTVQAGADIRRLARDASTVHQVEAKKGDIPVENETPFASTGAEGAGAEFNEADTTNIDYDCELHEQGVAVTDEMVDQAEIDKIEFQFRRAGEAVENAINRQFINELLDNATNYDADLSGSGNTDARDLFLKASETAADTDFDPTDVLVMHPEYSSELFGNNTMSKMQVTQNDTDADGPLGHDVFIQSGTAYDAGNQTFGFENDGEHGALVYGRAFVHLPVYRDIEISELQPPYTSIHDVQGGVARAYTDVVAAGEDDSGSYESVVRVER